MKYDTVDARISPEGRLSVLSKVEVNRFLIPSERAIQAVSQLLTRCTELRQFTWMMARNSWNATNLSTSALSRKRTWHQAGSQECASHCAVDGKIIRGINEHLFDRFEMSYIPTMRSDVTRN